MANVMKVIEERRSVRKYEEKDIPEEILNQILDAVKWSPSWANTQCWEIILIKDMGLREALQGTFGKGNPATKAIVSAPVLLAICGKLKSSGYYNNVSTTKFDDWFMFDLGIATQTLCLVAEGFGIGTVITGLFDHNKAKEILNVPDGYEVVSLVPMGYPAKKSSAPKRKEPSEYVHHDIF